MKISAVAITLLAVASARIQFFARAPQEALPSGIGSGIPTGTRSFSRPSGTGGAGPRASGTGGGFGDAPFPTAQDGGCGGVSGSAQPTGAPGSGNGQRGGGNGRGGNGNGGGSASGFQTRTRGSGSGSASRTGGRRGGGATATSTAAAAPTETSADEEA